MSKIEAGRIALNEDDFDLHRLLEGLEDMFRHRAQDKGLSLEFELNPRLPRFIHADEGKVRQVLMNLLGNAVKFTEEGGVVLRVFPAPVKGDSGEANHEEDSREIQRLTFEVSDTGPGIPESTRK
jgi:two-component system sensor histidine kinase/response regulator